MPFASAQSVFDGTWHGQQQSRSGGTTVTLLKDGLYNCTECGPTPVQIKADGTDRPVQGSPVLDTISVRETSPNSFTRIEKKNGKVVIESETTVSDDGNTKTIKTTNYALNSVQPVSMGQTWTRIGAAPTGANKTSGEWQLTESHTSAGDFTVTFTTDGDGLKMSNPAGEAWSAKFDGKDYPVSGVPGNVTVSLKRIDDHTFEETLKRDGSTYAVETHTISEDGNTMTETAKVIQTGAATTYIAHKQ